MITQRITESDIQHGQIRIPITGAAKSLLPQHAQEVAVVLRGHELRVKYDPRLGPDRERSGVLRIGRAVLAGLVAADERLTISIGSGNVIRFD